MVYRSLSIDLLAAASEKFGNFRYLFTEAWRFAKITTSFNAHNGSMGAKTHSFSIIHPYLSSSRLDSGCGYTLLIN